jgi:predicted extracellular nuclease
MRVLFLMIFTFFCSAQSRSILNNPQDPRGEVEAVVCSQNLQNFGTEREMAKRLGGITENLFESKLDALASRLARCDIIAVQELLGNEETAKAAAQALVQALKIKTGKIYDFVLGTPAETRVALFYAKERAEVLSALPYKNIELPKLVPERRPEVFQRAPLEVQLKVFGQGESLSRSVIIVVYHFKSKAGGRNDPTGLQNEITRMEQAEALRRIIQSRFRQSLASAEMPLILLGDRNSDFDSASARILEGRLRLEEFMNDAPCRLSKQGVPICQGGVERPQVLFSVISSDPETRAVGGTYSYKGKKSFIDDILMPHAALPLAWEFFDRSLNYRSGIVSSPKEASDHSMVWVALNW